MNYRISRRADTDIERICDYIAKDNPDAADRVDEHIHQAIRLLAEAAMLEPREARYHAHYGSALMRRKHVLEARVFGTGIDPPRALQLMNMPQALHPGVIDEGL